LYSGVYSNEYDYQLDIFKLISAAYDGHFAYTPDIVGVFFFLRLASESLASGTPDLYQIFSVSKDGTSLPDVYSTLDAAALINPNSARYTPSPITQINGEDVEDWLNTYAATSGTGKQQDPDANYNGLFPDMSGNSVPSLVGSFGNAFAQSSTYQGTDTVLKFSNGTTKHIITEAAASSDNRQIFAKSVTDGASFFKAFCSNNILQEASGSSSGVASPSSSAYAAFSSFAAKRDIITARAPQASSSGGLFGFSSILPSGTGIPFSSAIPSSLAAPSASGAVPSSQVPYKPVPTKAIKGFSPAFPDPFVAANDFSVAGYFPEAQDDLAVLAIPTYEPASESQFSNIVRELLATAKSSGKTKLIIDLRGEKEWAQGFSETIPTAVVAYGALRPYQSAVASETIADRLHSYFCRQSGRYRTSRHRYIQAALPIDGPVWRWYVNDRPSHTLCMRKALTLLRQLPRERLV
jgi:hypothetical protein